MTKRRKLRLKPCPFCKGKAFLWKDYDGCFYAGCMEAICEVGPRIFGQPTKQVAADTWNLRLYGTCKEIAM